MTRNADAAVATEQGPCEGCFYRRECSSFARPKACNAFESFSNGASVRVWRDADRNPSEVIGRRLFAQQFGSEAVVKVWPRASFKSFYLEILAANDDDALAKVAQRMTRSGYDASEIARIMMKTDTEVRALLARANLASS